MRLIRLVLPALMLLAATAASAQPANRVWAVALPKNGDAVLRYAFLNSDDLALGFMCTKGTGQIKVIAASPVRLNEPQDPDAPRASPVIASRPASITVISGAASATVPGRVGPDGEHGGSFLMTELSSASPVIQSFRKTGLLRVTALREAIDAPPTPKGMLGAFLRYCK